MVKKGQILDVEINRITNEGLGVGVTYDGTLVFVEGSTEGDDIIKAEIIGVGEESAVAKKISRSKSESSRNMKNTDSPYDLDEDDDEEDDESLFDEDEV